MSNLSPSTLALLRAAKTDAPTKEARATIWGGVTSGLVTHTPLHITPQGAAQGTGGGAGGAGASAGASLTPAAAGVAGLGKTALLGASMTATMKAAFIGALFGSAISIGVATVMLRAKSAEPSPTQGQLLQSRTSPGQSLGGAAVPRRNVEGSNSQGIESDPKPPTALDQGSGSGSNSATSSNAAAIDPSMLAVSAPKNDSSVARRGSIAKSSAAAGGSKASSGSNTANTLTTTSTAASEDLLSREVALVSEARRDLLIGDAAAALKAARAARSLEARQLEPEEMSLEARALRALGRDSEAGKVESSLRTMYPGQGR